MELGLLRQTGHEALNGCLIIPIFDEAGQVTEMYGRKIGKAFHQGTPLHLYLPGPHRGVFNVEALAASKSIILCEALIDALSFWCAGFENVTASYGIEGFTRDHWEAFERYGTERVYLAYDRDDAGERAAAVLSKRLLAKGIQCFRVQFPKGMDANDYACQVRPARKSLGLVLDKAVWMGTGAPPALTEASEADIIPLAAAAKEKKSPAEPTGSATNSAVPAAGLSMSLHHQPIPL
jgi:DNA primase